MDKQLAQHRTQEQGSRIAAAAHLNYEFAMYKVKSISRRKNVGWPMSKSKVWSNVLYVFVCLNDLSKPPSFFVATPSEVRPRVNQYRTRGILNFGSVNSPQFRDRWDKIEVAIHNARTTAP